MILDALEMLSDEHNKSCYCGKMFDLPIPKSRDNNISQETLDSAVTLGELDYPCHSKMSVPSIDQPRHDACVLAAD